MASKIGLWILVKLAEALAKKVRGKGDEFRTKVVDYLIVRAAKAKKTKTSTDDDILGFWAMFLKSNRLEEALKD